MHVFAKSEETIMNDLKIRFANIICDNNMSPTKLIISDGDYTSTIPVTNSNLRTCKRTAMEVYNVRPGNIIVSQLLSDNRKGRE